MEKVKEIERTGASEIIKFVLLVTSFVAVAMLSQVGEANSRISGEASSKRSSEAKSKTQPTLETLDKEVLTLRSPKNFKFERIQLNSESEITEDIKKSFLELGISTRSQRSLCATPSTSQKAKTSRKGSNSRALNRQVKQLEAQLELNYLVDHLASAETPRALSDRQKALVAKLPTCKTYLGRLRAVARLLQNYKVVKK